MFVGENPDGYAAPPQTADDAEGAVIAADDNRTFLI
jgi:hypothetical protein